MADPGKGRGRGLALLQALKKPQTTESSPSSSDPSPEVTPGPSVAPSVVSTSASSMIGGRGKIAAMMMAKMQPKVGGTFPASDVSPSPPVVTKGAGRGLKLLQTLKASQAAKSVDSGGQGDTQVQEITQKMAESTVGSVASTGQSTVGKNKYFKEVKETPPVVMKGESGTPCQVTSNFIYLNFEENNAYEYEVIYTPDQDYRAMRFKLLNEHNQFFKTKTFDGTTLYVPHMLPDEALELTSTHPIDQSKVKIKIVFRRTRRLSEMVHIYNVLFKQIMKDLQLVRFGRQHFNEHSAIQIPQHKLEVWPGYVTAVDEYEGGLMLTLDSTHRVLRTESVLSLINQAAQSEGSNWKRIVSDQLIGASVMTTYNKKLFKVDYIDDQMTPKSTFEKNEGGQLVKISYIDYYKKNYGIDIMDWDQPMLISKETKRLSGSDAPTEFLICLVPELCQLTGLTDNQRSNMRLMKDVATYTRITPNQRHSAFKKYIETVMNNEAARNRLKGWGLSIAPETINITARTLPPEALFFGNNIKIPGKPDANWNMDVTRHPMMRVVPMKRWAILFTERDKDVTKEFVDTLKRCAKPMGTSIDNPDFVRLVNDRTDTYIQALKKTITPNLQLVVAICSTSRDDRYAAIKKICCADQPIPSQVVNARTIMNQQKLRAITQKILLQMNCKLGGTLWHIAIPCKTAMIVGIDSYHDPSRKKPSVCSFIASYDQSASLWYSRAIFQNRGQEVVDGLKSGLVDSLTHYLKTNGKFPDRVIMYRDGVGDGQLDSIKKYEIPQMQVCFTHLEKTYRPTLTYIVVQKRINTRIFLKDHRGGYENPPPGTVVDHDITRRDWYDFLIASQKVTQGTVTPTHYVVVHDDSNMTPDQCQRLTYKLCHLYYNWPGTVRVPAPCQYAHKLADLVGASVHEVPSDTLADKLYFL